MPPVALWIVGNVLLLAGAYLLGSFPTGYLLGRWLKGIDIRTQGSGSTGATNVLRTLGRGPGLTVLLIDVLKGAAAITLTGWAYQSSLSWLDLTPADPAQWFPWMTVLSGLAAVLGHSRSVWLSFTGGKSVASGLGILLALNWQVGLMTLGVFGLILTVSRIVSLSSICAAVAVPLLMLSLRLPLAYILLGLVGGLYVVFRHKANMQRILAGTEPRLGEKIKAESNVLTLEP
jgi:acyl phosphate:glycerol-3-phosphate acyltransferase